MGKACDYVHLDPVRAKLLKSRQPFQSYIWSSYGEHLKSPGHGQRATCYGPTGYWGSGVFPRTARKGVGILAGGWNSGGAKSIPPRDSINLTTPNQAP